jgi:hypothetical protein
MDRIVPGILIPLFGMNAYYLNHLKQIDCSCAVNYTHFFLLCLSIFLTSVASISFIFGSKFIISLVAGYQELRLVTQLFLSPVFLIILFISLVLYVSRYISRLKKANCECLNSVYKNLDTIVNLIVFSLAGILLVFFIRSKLS